MEPDRNNPLGVQPLNHQSSREWVSLNGFLGGFIQFPATMSDSKDNVVEGTRTINRYPDAAIRMNADGMVIMRGLLRSSGGGNISTGNVVMTVPRAYMPKYPQELRFFGGTCVLSLDPITRELKVDILFVGASWLILSNVMYYVD